MNLPLLAFLAFIILIWGSILFFFRGALKQLSGAAAHHARAHALIYAKGGALVTASVLISFIDVFEKLSPDVASVLSWWSWLVLFLKPVLAGVVTLRAFLDGSVQRNTEKEAPTKPPFQPSP